MFGLHLEKLGAAGRAMDSASAREVPLALISSARMLLMSSPVLILTGHFSWHMPSAAHVASPWYSYAARIASSLPTKQLATDTAHELCRAQAEPEQERMALRHMHALVITYYNISVTHIPVIATYMPFNRADAALLPGKVSAVPSLAGALVP